MHAGLKFWNIPYFSKFLKCSVTEISVSTQSDAWLFDDPLGWKWKEMTMCRKQYFCYKPAQCIMLQIYVRPLTYFKRLWVCLLISLVGIKIMSVILLFLNKIFAENAQKSALKYNIFLKCLSWSFLRKTYPNSHKQDCWFAPRLDI